MPRSRNYRRRFESMSNHESWEAYSAGLKPFSTPAEEYFVRHVLFDHYDDFIRRFPWFQLESFAYAFSEFTADWIDSNVLYDDNEPLDWWYFHVESERPFPLCEYMRANHTWPTEPVIFDFGSRLVSLGSAPSITYHLIEGTHRISYLKRLLQKRSIRPNSIHRILTLQPSETNSTLLPQGSRTHKV